MKKLMILGGSHFLVPVIEYAHQVGLDVITCDYLPGNYAHQLADEYCNASVCDVDGVRQIARDNNIIGIMLFATDPGVTTACTVANEMGLPTVGRPESVRILQDKILFRDFLRNNGFQVPPKIFC